MTTLPTCRSPVANQSGASQRPSLFDLAASQLDAPSVLVVDDREDNLDRAAAAGFRTLPFDGTRPES